MFNLLLLQSIKQKKKILFYFEDSYTLHGNYIFNLL